MVSCGSRGIEEADDLLEDVDHALGKIDKKSGGPGRPWRTLFPPGLAELSTVVGALLARAKACVAAWFMICNG